MHTFRAMNTEFATFGLPLASQTKAEAWFGFVERNLSRFRQDSELSKLNRSAGRPFLASALLFQALSAAHRYYEETDGVFHPYLGNVLAELGYSASFETLASRKTAITNDAALDTAALPVLPPANGQAPAKLDAGMMSVVLREGFAADLGGFAKGWSADQLAGMLRKEGIQSGAIDAGGDIVLWGVPKRYWKIGVADPFDPQRDLTSLRFDRQAGIATSSRMKRRWTGSGGRQLHHLIDSRQLAPSESNLVQATVIAPTLTESEVYAKCLLLLGEEEGVPWLMEKHPEYAYIAVRQDRSILRSRTIELYTREEGVADASAI